MVTVHWQLAADHLLVRVLSKQTAGSFEKTAATRRLDKHDSCYQRAHLKLTIARCGIYQLGSPWNGSHEVLCAASIYGILSVVVRHHIEGACR
eukprot:1149508-Pelagomonas_calceolata.AAC.4